MEKRIKNFLQKLKLSWRVLVAREYYVFTTAENNDKITVSCKIHSEDFMTEHLESMEIKLRYEEKSNLE